MNIYACMVTYIRTSVLSSLSLKVGDVPFEWIEANIIPLSKKCSINNSEKYRPLNLTSVICKLIERLNRVDFLVRHILLNSPQLGFLKARSLLTNILCFLEDITKWIDEGSPVDIISFSQ